MGPPGVVLQEELESVQKRAARFVTGNYNYETGSMTGILGQLKWESLKKRRKDNRLILLYKGLKGKASVPTDDLIPKTRRCRNQHSMAFQTSIAKTDVYKGSFFPQTIRDWNALPDSLISSAEDAEDCVAKFTSLGLIPYSQVLVNNCRFGVSPVNYPDPDRYAFSFPVTFGGQCGSVLGHKFFMKASQILYAFVLFNMGWESQTAVLKRLEASKHFIFV